MGRRWAYEQARDGECKVRPTAAILQPPVKVATVAAGTKATFQDQDGQSSKSLRCSGDPAGKVGTQSISHLKELLSIIH